MLQRFWVLASLLLSLPAVAQIQGISSATGTDPLGIPDAEIARVIDPLIQRSGLVAIGESVHGSSGFLKMEHRLTRYLVERQGFRTILLENPVIRSRGLTKWVSDCRKGTPPAAPIDLLYMPVEEDRAFFGWMCEWNRRHPGDALVFRGMDIWDRPWEHQAEIERLARELGLAYDSPIAAARQNCWMHAEKDWGKYKDLVAYLKEHKQIPPAQYDPCRSALTTMRQSLLKEIARAKADRRYRLYSLLQSVDTAYAWQGNLNFRYQGFGKAWNERDQGQAKNEWSIFMQEGGKRAVLIAHTSHTSRMESPSDWWKTGLGAFQSGVSYLKRVFPGPITTIGLTGYEVSGTQGVWTIPTAAESLDRALHLQGLKLGYVYPLSPFVLARERWWVQNENSKDDYPDGVYMIPRHNFDLFLYFDQTLVGKAILPWRPVFQW